MIILYSVFYSYPLVFPNFVFLTSMEVEVEQMRQKKKQIIHMKQTKMMSNGVKQHTLNKHWKQQLNVNYTEHRRMNYEKWQDILKGKMSDFFFFFLMNKWIAVWRQNWIGEHICMSLNGTIRLNHQSISSQNPHKHTWSQWHTLLRKLQERAWKTSTLMQYRSKFAAW